MKINVVALSRCLGVPTATCAKRVDFGCRCLHCRHWLRVWRLGYSAGLKDGRR